MSEHLMPEAVCPHCKKVVDRASNVDGDGALPTPGDLTICIGCGTQLVFTEGLGLRLLLEGEFNNLSRETRANLNLATLAWRQMRASQS